MEEVSYVLDVVDSKFVFNSIALKSGTRIELFLDGKWFKGRVRYNSTKGLCFYNDDVGDVKLEEGMRVRKAL